VITLREFIKNIIHMNLTQANILSDELKIFVLKVLTRIITEKNVANKETMFAVDTWTPEFWSHCKDKVEGA
jgi:inositol 1,4,5-triphosphate receptor type 1/inositol 1,4,5-triphosphate receptor type 3